MRFKGVNEQLVSGMRKGLFGIALVLVFGTVGYRWVEDWGWLDPDTRVFGRGFLVARSQAVVPLPADTVSEDGLPRYWWQRRPARMPLPRQVEMPAPNTLAPQR